MINYRYLIDYLNYFTNKKDLTLPGPDITDLKLIHLKGLILISEPLKFLLVIGGCPIDVKGPPRLGIMFYIA